MLGQGQDVTLPGAAVFELLSLVPEVTTSGRVDPHQLPALGVHLVTDAGRQFSMAIQAREASPDPALARFLTASLGHFATVFGQTKQRLNERMAFVGVASMTFGAAGRQPIPAARRL